MTNPINRHDELRVLLERLNLGGMAAVFADLALKAAKENVSHEAYLFELGKHEEELRTQRRTARLLRASALPADKTFRNLNLGKLSPALQLQLERLKSGGFLESATNVVAVGRPGVGKSHCAAALGYELILQGHPVFWTPTSNLVQRLLAAKRDLRLPQELARLDKFACVILDDIGYVQHDRDEMEVLFTFLSERYETRSVMITTNLVWSRVEPHLQKSDDHDGGHRSRRSSLRHSGYDGDRELSCHRSEPPAATSRPDGQIGSTVHTRGETCRTGDGLALLNVTHSCYDNSVRYERQATKDEL